MNATVNLMQALLSGHGFIVLWFPRFFFASFAQLCFAKQVVSGFDLQTQARPFVFLLQELKLRH